MTIIDVKFIYSILRTPKWKQTHNTYYKNLAVGL